MAGPSRSRCCAKEPPDIACEQVTECVQLSGTHDNILDLAADGLYVPAPLLTSVSAGRGVIVGCLTPGLLTSVDPGSHAADGSAFALTCYGTGYTQDCKIIRNGVELTPNSITANAMQIGVVAPSSLGQWVIRARCGDRISPPLTVVFTVGALHGAARATTCTHYEVQSKVSGDAGNALSVHADGGIYVSSANSDGLQHVADTATVDLDLTAAILSGRIRRSARAGNLVRELADGLHADADFDTGALISTDIGNVVSEGSDDGLYVPGGRGAVDAGAGLYLDEPNHTMSVGWGQSVWMSADAINVKRSEEPGNRLQVGPDGVFVPASTFDGITAVASSDTISWDINASLGGRMFGHIIASPDPGNMLQLRGGGLYYPPATPATPAEVLSTDAGNDLALSTQDQKLFVPPRAPMPTPGAGMGWHTGNTAFGINTGPGFATSWVPPDNHMKLSTDSANRMTWGSDRGLFVAAPGPQPTRTQVATGGLGDVPVPGNSFQLFNFVSLGNTSGALFGHLAGGAFVFDESGRYYVAMCIQLRLAPSAAAWAVDLGPALAGQTSFGLWQSQYVQVLAGLRSYRIASVSRQNVQAGSQLKWALGAGPGAGSTIRPETVSLYIEKVR